MQKICRKLISGEKFNKLEIIEFSYRKNHRDYYLCKCECGKEKIIMGVCLYRKRGSVTKSCGCLNKQARIDSRKPYWYHAQKKIYHGYRSKAKERNISFELDWNTFIDLISKDCYYCGRWHQAYLRTWVGSPIFTYNGIDRINNDLGYTKNNCITCCIDCNIAKSHHSTEEFKKWASNVYKNINKIIELEKIINKAD